jgi:hypothetical protein
LKPRIQRHISSVWRKNKKKRRRLTSLFDKVIPPHWEFCGLSRQGLLYLCLAIGTILFIALPLTLGLVLGLPKERLFYPLPTNTGGIWTGEMTRCAFPIGAGVCGVKNGPRNHVGAVSHLVWDAMLNSTGARNRVDEGGREVPHPLCGMRIRAVHDVGGDEGRGLRSVDVVVTDRCADCGPRDLQLAPSAFERIAGSKEGDGDGLERIEGAWAWLDFLKG